MPDDKDYVFDKNGGFHPENLCNYGYHDVQGIGGSGQHNSKRGYVGLWLMDRGGAKWFQQDVENALHSGKMYIGTNSVNDYVKGIMGDSAWDEIESDFDIPVPYPDAIELRLGRKGNDFIILDTALMFSDVDLYPDDYTCRGCLDLYRFSAEERQTLVDVALDAVYNTYHLARDDILNGLVEWDIDKKSTDDYYEGCLFDKNGTFQAKNMSGVQRLNDTSMNIFAASGPASYDHFTVYFRGNQGFCSLKGDLNHGAKFGKIRVDDIDKYIGDMMPGELVEDDLAYGPEIDRPYPIPDYIGVDIGLNDGELEVRGSRLYFYDCETYGVDFTCNDFLGLDKLSDDEKAGIAQFALDTALGRCGLVPDEVKGRLIDRSSEYAKLVSASTRQSNDDAGDHGYDCDVGDE